MTIQDIKSILDNKLTFLNNEKVIQTSIGNLELVADIENQIMETTATVARINNLLSIN